MREDRPVRLAGRSCSKFLYTHPVKTRMRIRLKESVLHSLTDYFRRSKQKEKEQKKKKTKKKKKKKQPRLD